MATVTNKNITIDDIRRVLAGDDENAPIDPFSTNAGNIRTIIGRGSMATIQKFLNTIRAEIKGDSESDKETPTITIKPDTELLSSIWNTVVKGVSESVLKKIVALNDDRDALRDSLSVANQDIGSLTDEVERLESELDARMVLESEISTLTARLDDAQTQNSVLAGLIKKSLDSEDDKQDNAATTRKQRTVITPEITCEVLDMLSKGVAVGDVAKNIDISVGSVNKIKKEHDKKMQNHRDKLNIE